MERSNNGVTFDRFKQPKKKRARLITNSIDNDYWVGLFEDIFGKQHNGWQQRFGRFRAFFEHGHDLHTDFSGQGCAEQIYRMFFRTWNRLASRSRAARSCGGLLTAMRCVNEFFGIKTFAPSTSWETCWKGCLQEPIVMLFLLAGRQWTREEHIVARPAWQRVLITELRVTYERAEKRCLAKASSRNARYMGCVVHVFRRHCQAMMLAIQCVQISQAPCASHGR